jgi:hypothetical protein
MCVCIKQSGRIDREFLLSVVEWEKAEASMRIPTKILGLRALSLKKRRRKKDERMNGFARMKTSHKPSV